MTDFRKDKTGVAQTASRSASGIVSSAVEAGIIKNVEEAFNTYAEQYKSIFAELAGVVDADNEMFAGISSNGGGSSSSKSSGSTSRGRKTSGGRRSGGGGGGFTGDLAEALDMKLKFGAFKGEKLGALLDYDVDTCQDEFEYGNGERDGRDYISWVAKTSNENEYARDAARLVADANGIDYE